MLYEKGQEGMTGKSKRSFANDMRITQVEKGSIILDLMTTIPNYLDAIPSVLKALLYVGELIRLFGNHPSNTNNINVGCTINTTIVNNYGSNIHSEDNKSDLFFERFILSAVKNGNAITIVEEGYALKLWKDKTSNDIYARVIDASHGGAPECKDSISRAMNGQGFEALNGIFRQNQ